MYYERRGESENKGVCGVRTVGKGRRGQGFGNSDGGLGLLSDSEYCFARQGTGDLCVRGHGVIPISNMWPVHVMPPNYIDDVAGEGK